MPGHGASIKSLKGLKSEICVYGNTEVCALCTVIITERESSLDVRKTTPHRDAIRKKVLSLLLSLSIIIKS